MATTPMTLSGLLRRRLGDRAVVVSAPDPPLGRLNVLGVFDEVEQARTAIRHLEGIARADEDLTFVGLRSHPTTGAGPADPEGAASYALRHGIMLGVIGAVIGALLVGLISGLVAGDGTVAVAAGIGGAILFGAVGVMVGAFARLGASDAYRETFTVDEPEACLVAVHVEDADQAESTVTALTAAGARDVVVVDDQGLEQAPGH